MDGDISNPTPVLASLDETTAALAAVKNLEKCGRGVGILRAMFTSCGSEQKPVVETREKAKQSLRASSRVLRRDPAFSCPSVHSELRS